MPEDKEKQQEQPKLTVGSLRELIREEITSIAGSLFPKGQQSTGDGGNPPSGGTQAQNENSIRLEVGRALNVLRAKEARDERESKIDALLAERAEAKPTQETPPVERRRVEKFMRWE